MDAAVTTVANAFKAALQPFEQRIKALGAENVELQRRVTLLETANKSLKQDTMELEGLLNEDNTEIAAIRKRLKVLEEVEASHKDLAKENAQLKLQMSNLEEQLLKVIDTVLGNASLLTPNEGTKELSSASATASSAPPAPGAPSPPPPTSESQPSKPKSTLSSSAPPWVPPSRLLRPPTAEGMTITVGSNPPPVSLVHVDRSMGAFMTSTDGHESSVHYASKLTHQPAPNVTHSSHPTTPHMSPDLASQSPPSPPPPQLLSLHHADPHAPDGRAPGLLPLPSSSSRSSTPPVDHPVSQALGSLQSGPQATASLAQTHTALHALAQGVAPERSPPPTPKSSISSTAPHPSSTDQPNLNRRVYTQEFLYTLAPRGATCPNSVKAVTEIVCPFQLPATALSHHPSPSTDAKPDIATAPAPLPLSPSAGATAQPTLPPPPITPQLPRPMVEHLERSYITIVKSIVLEEERQWQTIRIVHRAVVLLMTYQLAPAVALLKLEATGPDIWGTVLREIRNMEIPTGKLRVALGLRPDEYTMDSTMASLVQRACSCGGHNECLICHSRDCPIEGVLLTNALISKLKASHDNYKASIFGTSAMLQPDPRLASSATPNPPSPPRYRAPLTAQPQLPYQPPSSFSGRAADSRSAKGRRPGHGPPQSSRNAASSHSTFAPSRSSFPSRQPGGAIGPGGGSNGIIGGKKASGLDMFLKSRR